MRLPASHGSVTSRNAQRPAPPQLFSAGIHSARRGGRYRPASGSNAKPQKLAAEHHIETTQNQLQFQLAELAEPLSQRRAVQCRDLRHVGHRVALKSRLA